MPTGWVVGWGLLCIQLRPVRGSVAAAIALTFVQSDLGLAMVSAGGDLRDPDHRAVRHGKRLGEHGLGLREAHGGSRRASDFEKAEHAPGLPLPLVAARDRGVLLLLAKGRNRAYIREGSWSSATRQ